MGVANAQIFTVDPTIKNDKSEYASITYTPSFTSPEWESAPTIAWDDVLEEGYTYDVIFLGEGAGFDASDLYFVGDAGTTDETYTVFSDISSPPLVKGDYVTVSVGDNWDAVADTYLFDFMLDSDEPHSNNYGLSDFGNFYLFDWSKDVGDNPAAKAPNGVYNTENYGAKYLVFAFEDLGTWDSDEDFNDLVFAINLNGTQVPEPSTYGIIGALALLGLVVSRRFRK